MGRSAARRPTSASAALGDRPSLTAAVAAQAARNIGSPRSSNARRPLAARRETWLSSINPTCSAVLEVTNHQRPKSPAATSRQRTSHVSTLPTRCAPGSPRRSQASCVVFPTLSTPLSDTDRGPASTVTPRSGTSSRSARREAVGGRQRHHPRGRRRHRPTRRVAAAPRRPRPGRRPTRPECSRGPRLTPLDYQSIDVAAIALRRIATDTETDTDTDTDTDEPTGADGTGVAISAAGTEAAGTEAAGAADGTAGEPVDPGGAHVVSVRLPAGPAVVTTQVRTVTADGTDSAVSVPAGVLQAMIPAPEHQALLVITLTTPCLQDFTAYSQDAAALARSIRFTDPTPPDQAGSTPDRAPAGLIGTTALPTRHTPPDPDAAGHHDPR